MARGATTTPACHALLDRNKMHRDREGELPQAFGEADLGRRELVTVERGGRRNKQVGVIEYTSCLLGAALCPKPRSDVPPLSPGGIEAEHLHSSP